MEIQLFQKRVFGKSFQLPRKFLRGGFYQNINCLYTGSFFVIKMFKPLINYFFNIRKINKIQQFAPPQETSGELKAQGI